VVQARLQRARGRAALVDVQPEQAAPQRGGAHGRHQPQRGGERRGREREVDLRQRTRAAQRSDTWARCASALRLRGGRARMRRFTPASGMRRKSATKSGTGSRRRSATATQRRGGAARAAPAPRAGDAGDAAGAPVRLAFGDEFTALVGVAAAARVRGGILFAAAWKTEAKGRSHAREDAACSSAARCARLRASRASSRSTPAWSACARGQHGAAGTQHIARVGRARALRAAPPARIPRGCCRTGSHRLPPQLPRARRCRRGAPHARDAALGGYRRHPPRWPRTRPRASTRRATRRPGSSTRRGGARAVECATSASWVRLRGCVINHSLPSRSAPALAPSRKHAAAAQLARGRRGRARDERAGAAAARACTCCFLRVAARRPCAGGARVPWLARSAARALAVDVPRSVARERRRRARHRRSAAWRGGARCRRLAHAQRDRVPRSYR
jgi:hypothetical protein